MKLIPEKEVFIAECHTSDCGYESDDHYAFPSKEELENFLGVNNDYENHIYKRGIDIFDRERSLGSNEYPNYIYSKIEYRVDWN